MAAVTLEAFRANRRRLPTVIHMHIDRPHDARFKHKGKLQPAIPLIDCLDHKKTWKGQELPTRKTLYGLPSHSHKAHTDRQIESKN